MNKKFNLGSMSIDEMWQLHEEISQVLSVRLTAEKRELEKRLAQLHGEKSSLPATTSERQLVKTRERRKYPKVMPKYQNPNKTYETWSGRGKQPRWLIAALEAGHTIEEFAIESD